jgi:hypothetical protein
MVALSGCAVGQTCVDLQATERFGVRAGVCVDGEQEEDRDAPDALEVR